ncbi:hypothetical protein VJJ74_07780 [Parvimonas micra]|nr:MULTISPECIES: hypothetical protein [Parvimonas]MEB3061038.1 hypothetical protein [Parvimonas micra]MEB3089953.1 hypothetical protein [Parvimonas sp. M20]
MNDYGILSALTPHFSILLGVFFGTVARYSLMVREGEAVRMRSVTADLLLVGAVVIFAIWTKAKVGFEQEDSVAIGALYALTADKAVKKIQTWWLGRIDKNFPANGEEGKFDH